MCMLTHLQRGRHRLAVELHLELLVRTTKEIFKIFQGSVGSSCPPAMQQVVDGVCGDCSKKYGIDLSTPEARKRGHLVIVNTCFALEWPRPLPPNIKLVGPMLATDSKPLTPEFEVGPVAPLPQVTCVVTSISNPK
jgi:hypothetical protein